MSFFNKVIKKEKLTTKEYFFRIIKFFIIAIISVCALYLLISFILVSWMLILFTFGHQ